MNNKISQELCVLLAMSFISSLELSAVPDGLHSQVRLSRFVSQVIFDESFLVPFKICKRLYAKNIFYPFYVTNGMASILNNH